MAEEISYDDLSRLEIESRLYNLEQAGAMVVLAVWEQIRRGAMDERSVIADATIRLRDALNPTDDPDWLPINPGDA